MAGGRDSYKKFKKIYTGTGLDQIYTAWHDRQVQKLQNLLEDKKFKADIKMMKGKEWADVTLDQKIFALNVKYKLQVAMYELLEHYFVKGKINPYVMRSPVVAINTKSKKAFPSFSINKGDIFYQWIAEQYRLNPDRFLFFWIDPECTKGDMKHWVEIWWTKIVKPMQDELRLSEVKRVRTSNNIKRDRDIHEQLKVKKRPAKDVTKDVKGKVSDEYARQIAYRKSGKHPKVK